MSPENRGWLSRSKASAALILGLCAVSVFFIQISLNSSRSKKTDETFTVIQRHYGIDAAEMERNAAVPLEDALSRIEGLKKIRSISENGSARVFVHFEGRNPGRYEAVREAAQKVYTRLPSSAQRPEILSSDDSRIPAWTAAVSASGGISPGRILERTVKPALEALEGAGEVEISGASLTEIIITLDEHKAALFGIYAGDIAEILAYNDALFPGGKLREGNFEIPVVIDGRYADLRDLKRALIPVRGKGGKRFIALQDIAQIREEEKESQSRSRLNGKETAVIAVMPSGGASMGRLSGLIKKELEKTTGLEFTVLSDRGAEESAAYRSVLSAAAQASLAVALMTALLCYRKGRLLLVLAAACSVPVILLFSAALLRVFGFELDKLVLAGLSAGAGAAVDAVILSAEYMGSASLAEGRNAYKALCFPLVSGSATTIIALLPFVPGASAGDFIPVAWAVGSVNFVSMILALTLLPPLFLQPSTVQNRQNLFPFQKFRKTSTFSKFISALRSCSRALSRILAFHVRLCVKGPVPVIAFWLFLTVLGSASLFLRGTGAEREDSENSVYAQIEFEGGLHGDEVDRLLARYGESLKQEKGILNVQTSARTGSGSVLLAFDPALLDSQKARKLLRSHHVPGGFVYIGEVSSGEQFWEIRISGDDGMLCRELALEAARICGNIPLVSETVLHFKEGRSRLTLKAGRERFSEAGVSFASAGGTIRYGVHGPVVYKRIDVKGETDVRLRWGNSGDGTSGREAVRHSLVAGNSRFIEAGALFSETEDREPSSIQRLDRRRSASLSVRTGAMDPRKARDKIMPALARLELPPGYSVVFDPGAIKAAEKTSASIHLFILALLFCYMVIAASKESFLFPLAVLAVVPPSLAFPALCSGALNAASASAFVAVSGMAVNAAVLIADGVGNFCSDADLYRILRKRLPVLLATSGTTAAGALPFLFLGNASVSLVKALSLTAALGVTASTFCSLSLIPALAICFPRLFKPHPL